MLSTIGLDGVKRKKVAGTAPQADGLNADCQLLTQL
jgi:hypothetical protein